MYGKQDHREIPVDGCTDFHQQKEGVRNMLRDMMGGERPHTSSAGAVSWPVLAASHSFIHKYFWLTVHVPAMAPGTPDRPTKRMVV
jgi:hypothetical protein